MLAYKVDSWRFVWKGLSSAMQALRNPFQYVKDAHLKKLLVISKFTIPLQLQRSLHNISALSIISYCSEIIVAMRHRMCYEIIGNHVHNSRNHVRRGHYMIIETSWGENEGWDGNGQRCQLFTVATVSDGWERSISIPLMASLPINSFMSLRNYDSTYMTIHEQLSACITVLYFV